MAFRYLLFDLDGTLIDTTELILSCYHATLNKLVDDPPTDAEILKGFGTPLPAQLHRLYPTMRDRLDEMLVLWKQAQEELHDRLIKPFPESVGVVAELRRRGYPMAVVTSKERKAAERDMELYGLRSMMDAAVFWDDTEDHKPLPAPVLKALELLAARPEETLYVGDSLHDMQAGQRAGVKVAAAMWGPFPKEPLLASGPDYLLRSVRDLLDLCP